FVASAFRRTAIGPLKPAATVNSYGPIIVSPLFAGCSPFEVAMKRAVSLVAVIGMASTVMMAAGKETVSGQYVEAATAEIFTGGCIMGSEAETMGKQAVLAWKVDRGTVNGVSLDGLAVVAALSGDV